VLVLFGGGGEEKVLKVGGHCCVSLEDVICGGGRGTQGGARGGHRWGVHAG
jgi:hypothetical protein